MATLIKPVYIRDKASGIVYECECYTAETDAKPLTCNAGTGNAWELKNNNITSYVGLWPSEATNTPLLRADDSSDISVLTPLTIKKGDKTYRAMRYVLNVCNVTIKATTNQTIAFSYYDMSNTQHTINVTTSDVTVTALPGTAYTCSVTADIGYTKGGIQGASSSGYIESDMEISVTAATMNSYVMTIIVPVGAVISVGEVKYSAGTYTTTYNYNDSAVISCTSTNTAQYTVSDLSAGGSFISNGTTFTMPANSVTVTCTSTINKYLVRIEEATGTKVTVTADGVNVPSGSSCNYGTVLTYFVEDTNANDAYENPAVDVYDYDANFMISENIVNAVGNVENTSFTATKATVNDTTLILE